MSFQNSFDAGRRALLECGDSSPCSEDVNQLLRAVTTLAVRSGGSRIAVRSSQSKFMADLALKPSQRGSTGIVCRFI